MAKAKGRALKGVFSVALGALGFGAMSAAGFTPGSDSGIEGLDGSTIRDAVSGALTVGGMFLPQLAVVANVYKSLTNHRDVEEVTTTTAGQNDTLANHARCLKAIEKTLREWEDA